MRALWALLASRLLLFAAAQAVVATCLWAAGVRGPWEAAAGWWTVAAAVANLVSIGLIGVVARREGLPLGQVWRPRSEGTVRGDLLWLLGTLVVLGPVAQGPSVGLAWLLWGDPQVPMALVRPIPPAAAWFGLVAFPLTVGFAELPTYFGLIRPRLEARGWSPAAAVAVTALFLSLQHATLPSLWDARFALWRATMFLGFAALVGVVLRLRPRLLPWFMAAHAALDVTAAWFVVAASG